MTTLKSIDSQPTKMDYASPTQFRFSIIKLPKVEYFCTAANIPGITMGTFEQQTPLKDIPILSFVIIFDLLFSPSSLSTIRRSRAGKD